jgi:hypothetical protein
LKQGDASQFQLQGSFTIGLCVSDALSSLKDSSFFIFGTFLESFSLQALNLPGRRLRKGRKIDFLIFLGIYTLIKDFYSGFILLYFLYLEKKPCWNRGDRSEGKKMAIPEVSELMAHLHQNIDSLHATLSSLSDTSTHEAAVSKLEAEREARLESLTQKHKVELKYIADLRKTVQDNILLKRKQEEEEILERRRKEDEERRVRIEKEEEEREKLVKKADERMEKERVEKERVLVGDVEAEIERLEEEMERKVEEGRRRVQELDGRRKEINKKIDEMLTAPTTFPQIQFRRRSKAGKHESATPTPNGLIIGHAESHIANPTIPPPTRTPEEVSQAEVIPPSSRSITSPATKSPSVSLPTSPPNSGPAGLVALLGSQNGTVSKAPEQSKTIPIPGTMAHSLDSLRAVEVTKPAIRHVSPGEWLRSIGGEPKEMGSGAREVEDPEDVKAREEIARLNAEMMAAAENEKGMNRKDPLLSRLWNSETYVAHRFFAGPRPYDPMLNRLWSKEKYMSYIHTIPLSDPMLDRLWNGEKKAERRDPMISRLWSHETYIPHRFFQGESRADPMMQRLWCNEGYMPYIHTIPRSDPMLDRLFSAKAYSSRSENKLSLELAGEVKRVDPMIARLWNDEVYVAHRYFQGGKREDRMIERLWTGERYRVERRDPMIGRLWSGEAYVAHRYFQGGKSEDRMIKRLWTGESYMGYIHTIPRGDTMLDRLWNGERYREERKDPMIERLWSGEAYVAHRYFQGGKSEDRMIERLWSGEKYMPYIHTLHTDDPMLLRLWNRERYIAQSEVVGQGRDPMITRLWSAVRYREDMMLDRLWNGDSYLIENHSPVLKPAENSTSQSFKGRREQPLGKQSGASRHDPMFKRLWWDEKYEFSIKGEPSVIEREITSTSSEASDHHSDMPSASINELHYLHGGNTDDISHLNIASSPVTITHDENPFDDPISESESDSYENDAPSRPPMSTFLSALSPQPQLSPTSHSEASVYDYGAAYQEDNTSAPVTPNRRTSFLSPESQRSPTSNSENSLYDYGAAHEEDHASTPVAPNRRASILSTFRYSIPEIPLVNQLLGRTSYSSIENEEEDLGEFDAYGQRPLNFNRPSMENLHAHARFADSESEEEFPLRRSDTNGLHVRTQTLDTVPSIEDGDSIGTPSDTPSSPFREIPHNQLRHEEPEIHNSWSPPRDREDGPRDEVPMEPQASPIRNDFDPYNSATYDFVKSRSNMGSLKRQGSGIEGFFNSVPQSSIKPKLNTSLHQEKDSETPVSANRLSIHSGEWPVPPSFSNGRVELSKTPANSPASAMEPASNVSGLFQRTRSLFEAPSAKFSPTAPIKNARPRSAFFGASAPQQVVGNGNGNSSPIASISSISGRSRTDSLHQNEAREEVIIPKSLDGDGKPPSPTFSLPPPVPPKSTPAPVYQNRARRGTLMMANDRAANGDGTFLDGLRMNRRESVGKVLGGLGEIIHNPNRSSRFERQSLLNNGDDA